MATSSEWIRQPSQQMDGNQALIVAAMDGDASMVTSLLAADVNITNEVSCMSLDSLDIDA